MRFVALLALCVSACTCVVRPPDDPADPQRVFVLYESRHRGIVLPAPSGGWIEYGYGDHDWYALGRTAWYHAFDTVLWPTQGALGRRRIAAGPAGLPAVAETVRLVPLTVDSKRARSLVLELEQLHAARAGEVVRDAARRLDFVPVSAGFWAFHNCNDAVARWLEDLGCDVSWAPIRTDVAVRGAAP